MQEHVITETRTRFISPDRSIDLRDTFTSNHEARRAAAIASLPQLAPPGERSFERAFIERCARDFCLEEGRWGAFLTAWSRAVQAFGTPLSFLDSLSAREVSLRMERESFPAHSVSFLDRRALVASYNSQFPITPQKGDYGPLLKLSPTSCVLCECVAKSEDDKASSATNSSVTLLEYMGFSLMANRFPWEPGNLLLIPLSHDPEDPAAEFENVLHRHQVQGPGMANRMPSAYYLEALLQVADLFDFVAIRNHPQSGMSQPQHDHAHCFPSALQKGLIPRMLANVAKFSTGELNAVQAFESPLSPFSVMVLSSSNRPLLAERGSSLLCKLERDGLAPVCAYYDGALSIGVLNPMAARPTPVAQCGARVLLNYFTDSELSNFNRTSEFFPTKGTFDWKTYLE